MGAFTRTTVVTFKSAFTTAMPEPYNVCGGAGKRSLQFPVRLELSLLANRGKYGRKSGVWQGLS